MRWVLALVAGLGIVGHSQAAEAPAACSGAPTPVPAEFSGWQAASPVTAGTTAGAAQRINLPIGAARKLALAFGSTVTHAAPPERPDAGAGKAGMASFDVAKAGLYRVALSAGAWVEVVRDGRTTKSVAHGHGPECSGIRKIVDFQLVPGRYILQLSASDAPEVTAMIAPGIVPDSAPATARHGSAH